MFATASTRHSDYGMTCAQCGDLLIAPEWSEHVNERHVLNLWSCTKCGCEFETTTFVPVSVPSMNNNIAIKAFYPSLLGA